MRTESGDRIPASCKSCYRDWASKHNMDKCVGIYIYLHIYFCVYIYIYEGVGVYVYVGVYVGVRVYECVGMYFMCVYVYVCVCRRWIFILWWFSSRLQLTHTHSPSLSPSLSPSSLSPSSTLQAARVGTDEKPGGIASANGRWKRKGANGVVDILGGSGGGSGGEEMPGATSTHGKATRRTSRLGNVEVF